MHTVISTWTDIIQQFFPIFTAPGADIFLVERSLCRPYLLSILR